MLKKYLCLALCSLLMLGITVPMVSAEMVADEFDVANVRFSATGGEDTLLGFPAVGSTVVASTQITNLAESARNAVLWMGVYTDGVLVATKYRFLTIAQGRTQELMTPPLTMPQGSQASNTTIKAFVWNSFFGGRYLAPVANFLESNGTIKGIYIDDMLLEGFHPSKADYTYQVPAPLLKRPVITANATDNATKVEISDYTIPGTATVTVTAGNGAIKTYSIEMKYGPGAISNLHNNLSSATYKAFYNMRPQSLQGLRDVYRAVGTGWEEYCRLFVDRGLSATNGIVDIGSYNALAIPGENYPHTGTGNYLMDYGPGWATMWIAKNARATAPAGTSDFYSGATWIAAGNNERAAAVMQTNRPDAITFDINRGATVYLICQLMNCTNLLANGWVEGTDSKYAVVHGDGSVRNRYYVKHFDAGEVQIPTTGQPSAGDRMYMPIIIWDAPMDMDNADIRSISFKMSSDTSYPDIPGVSANVMEYEVKIPSDSNPGDVPLLKAVPADTRSRVKISYPDTIPGSAQIRITSVSGVVKTYTVNLTL